MFSVDPILIYDRLLQNEPFFNSRFNKKVMDYFCKGTYAGIRSYKKFAGEKVRLQKGKWCGMNCPEEVQNAAWRR